MTLRGKGMIGMKPMKKGYYERPRCFRLIFAAIRVLVDTNLMTDEEGEAMIAKAAAQEL